MLDETYSDSNNNSILEIIISFHNILLLFYPTRDRYEVRESLFQAHNEAQKEWTKGSLDSGDIKSLTSPLYRLFLTEGGEKK